MCAKLRVPSATNPRYHREAATDPAGTPRSSTAHNAFPAAILATSYSLAKTLRFAAGSDQ
jgi:hypothetical protein